MRLFGSILLIAGNLGIAILAILVLFLALGGMDGHIFAQIAAIIFFPATIFLFPIYAAISLGHWWLAAAVYGGAFLLKIISTCGFHLKNLPYKQQ